MKEANFQDAEMLKLYQERSRRNAQKAKECFVKIYRMEEKNVFHIDILAEDVYNLMYTTKNTKETNRGLINHSQEE